ncbi:TOBE-like domain-containing protein [Marinobacter lutaoensis]|jgi:sulfate transport system ATP-binding protein|uniref:Sulfate ABC transporter ATP-binding protein n=1 Tax=Marinobacter lutaoensis TaxID=135739 RepID=A0A1V2DUS1_9GAMM|nr:TOBE-like domain-containing protein [Marinobacter lutaoensis]MBE02123.1 sulfate ABC transporter ATP-binding protein [Marinobacter sp.]MBI42435.1 sulfate ABC transporter ATP-binding protein [Oceanospirillales bacterium]NVD35514.1 TOBE-like domain-containing protein [Marinobacter lutaoensis]ONF44086.1 sulfate ABC transporter ATP-binding protein [Marinobacter lutaoensis]|tara:strand:- start:451 stop:1578 length:1128 start_codon:yes stop_codon:yes gene_type:complete
MSIVVDGISKYFGNFQALHDVSLELPEGKLTALLGPSGSGKTTLLRIIAGLESAERGRILFNGQDVTALHVRDRNIGFVFQHYALFRHLTVAQNIAFGLDALPRRERPSKPEIRKRVAELLEMIQLPHLANRYPSQLSGGQKQRVALARALATQPRILLLDEPFGALDARVRKDLRRWLRALHDEFHFTSVFVTHDQEEALELSDQVVVMSQGRVEQVDAPAALYARPDSRFVFDFLGHVNVLSGRIQGQVLRQGEAWVRLPGQPPEQDAQLYLRPHEVRLVPKPTPHACLPFTVEAVSLIGAEVRVELSPAGWESEEIWEVGISHGEFARQPLARGDRWYATPDVGHLFLAHAEKPDTLHWEPAHYLEAAGSGI